MAIGVSFSQGDMSVGLPLTTAIALQDIPEGLAVALAMCAAGFRPGKAVLVAIGSGLLEPLGALLGVGLSSGLAIAYPIGLGLAAGAMLFVVSHEVIPRLTAMATNPRHPGPDGRVCLDDDPRYGTWLIRSDIWRNV